MKQKIIMSLFTLILISVFEIGCKSNNATSSLKDRIKGSDRIEAYQFSGVKIPSDLMYKIIDEITLTEIPEDQISLLDGYLIGFHSEKETITAFFTPESWTLNGNDYAYRNPKIAKQHIEELETVLFPNQQVDPIVTTPVDEVEAQSTQGHP